MNHIKHFSMFILIVIFHGELLLAQQTELLNANYINAGINASGDLFNDSYLRKSLFEVPDGSGKKAIYAASLWIGGYDEGGNLRLAANTYRQSNLTDFYAGPVAKIYDNAYDQKYNRVWKVDDEMIKNHILNYKSVGYEMPEVIRNWPANGNPLNQESFNLAPYQDVNKNGIYDPQNGDYPRIFGNQAVYFIINDIRSAHTQTRALPLGVEIHGMVYSFNALTNPSLYSTVFLNYKVINRSRNNYNNVYLGLWVDFGLGYHIDDLCGSDSSRSMFFCYNADNFDEGVNGYGHKPPVIGIRSLNNKMTGFVNYFNDWSLIGNPSEATHYYSYLSGRYKNGTLIDSTSKFMSKGTYMYDNKYSGADVRGIGTYGPIELLSRESVCLDYAITFARDPNKDHLTNIETLNYLSGEVKKIYNNSTLGCNCNFSSYQNKPFIPELKVYPVPAKDKVIIETSGLLDEKTEIILLSSDGKIISTDILYSNSSHYILSTENLVNGVYFIKIKNSEITTTRQIVIIN